ncbi:hypothetical protein D9M71_437770 [compost metagenome]
MRDDDARRSNSERFIDRKIDPMMANPYRVAASHSSGHLSGTPRRTGARPCPQGKVVPFPPSQRGPLPPGLGAPSVPLDAQAPGGCPSRSPGRFPARSTLRPRTARGPRRESGRAGDGHGRRRATSPAAQWQAVPCRPPNGWGWRGRGSDGWEGAPTPGTIAGATVWSGPCPRQVGAADLARMAYACP